MRCFLALPLLLLATPALAQFPPPGVYACERADADYGELTLFVAGDYSFKGMDGNAASGQVASAGSRIDPLSGPLKDAQLKGEFLTDEVGATTFVFTGPADLRVTCR